MNLHRLLQRRVEQSGPVRVGLIGAGKFGTMFLSQVSTTPGLEVAAIADLSPDRARAACRSTGWDAGRIDAVRFTDAAMALMEDARIEVVIEATGHPAAGLRHAIGAIDAGKHIVMVNVEADALAGPLLAERAARAGVVYSLAYGDQPALVCEMVDWARTCGFAVIAAGKGTKYLPEFHASTPATVWGYYGLTPEAAAAGGMNPQMFNSFLDGTKSAIEMAAIANATGLTPPPDGLGFPPCGARELASVLRPSNEGGALHHAGQVEVVSSVHRDGSPVVVIGHSLGGVYARELAARDPERIERVITLGSPINAPRDSCHRAVRAVADSIAVLRGQREGCLTESCSCGLELTQRRTHAVPITVVYSRTDGIVHWESCIDQTSSGLVDHVEVMGSHVGMALSPDVFRIIADRLAMPRPEARPPSTRLLRLISPRPASTR